MRKPSIPQFAYTTQDFKIDIQDAILQVYAIVLSFLDASYCATTRLRLACASSVFVSAVRKAYMKPT